MLKLLLSLITFSILLCNAQILNAQEHENMISEDLRNKSEKLDLKKLHNVSYVKNFGRDIKKKKWKEIIKGYEIKYIDNYDNIKAKNNFWGTEQKGNHVRRISFYVRNKDLDSVLVEFESDGNYFLSRRGITKIDKSTDWTLIDDDVQEYGNITPVEFSNIGLKFSLKFLYKLHSGYPYNNDFSNVKWSINNSTNNLTIKPTFGNYKSTRNTLNAQGLIFSLDGLEVAAIQLNGEGWKHNHKTYLWISKDLDSNQKLIFSAFAVLLKHSRWFNFRELKIYLEFRDEDITLNKQ